MGEKVGAVLVPVPGTTINVQAVLAYLRERIADFKVPEYVVVRPDVLPRNPGGKLLKRPLRDGTPWDSPRPSQAPDPQPVRRPFGSLHASSPLRFGALA